MGINIHSILPGLGTAKTSTDVIWKGCNRPKLWEMHEVISICWCCAAIKKKTDGASRCGVKLAIMPARSHPHASDQQAQPQSRQTSTVQPDPEQWIAGVGYHRASAHQMKQLCASPIVGFPEFGWVIKELVSANLPKASVSCSYASWLLETSMHKCLL